MDGEPPKPHQQAVSPISGTAPPAEYQFKPGQSGNPAGRAANLGSSVRECLNSFADFTEPELRRIATGKNESYVRRSAAIEMLHGLEMPDISDFAPVLNGEKKIEQLRDAGVNTEVVRKFKQKSRVVPIGDGTTEQIIEREIELRDRGGESRERVNDRTAGKPISHDQVQRIERLEELSLERDGARNGER